MVAVRRAAAPGVPHARRRARVAAGRGGEGGVWRRGEGEGERVRVDGALEGGLEVESRRVLKAREGRHARGGVEQCDDRGWALARRWGELGGCLVEEAGQRHDDREGGCGVGEVRRVRGGPRFVVRDEGAGERVGEQGGERVGHRGEEGGVGE